MTDVKSHDEIEVWVTSLVLADPDSGSGGFDDPDDDSDDDSDMVQTHSTRRLDISNVFNRAVATTVNSDEFIASWRKAFRAVEAVFAADSQPDSRSKFVLESVTAKLSLTATGKVAFVGELGGNVAFEASFRRRSP